MAAANAAAATAPLTQIAKPAGEILDTVRNAPRNLGNLFARPSISSADILAFVKKLLPVVLLIVIVVGAVYLLRNSTQTPDTSPQNVARVEAERQKELSAQPALLAKKTLYGELIRQLDPSEQYLVNLCPLTAVWPGYIGPVSKGVFSPKFYVKRALDAGIRSFVLPISWHKKPEFRAPQWPEQLRPGCMMRDSNEQIISINGMTVRSFVNELFIEIGNAGVQQADEPLLLTFVTTPSCPDRIRSEADYVRMMCQIGQELSSVSAFMSRRLATLGSYGSATGGAREKEILLETPLEDLRSKVLVFTDFDTKLVLKDEYKDDRVFVRPSLYDFVNIHLHPDPACCAKPGQVLNGKMIHMSDISGSKTDWKTEARTVWHSTLADGPIVTPPDAKLLDAANASGIQMVPVPFFMSKEDTDKVSAIWNLYNGFAWRVKPGPARYSKPAPIVPAKPSEVLNARVASNLQPGQTQIT